MFDTLNKDSDCVLAIADVVTWVDRMKSLCQSTDEEIEIVRGALRTFFLNRGVTGEGMRRENWIEGNRVFAEAERERERRGEDRLMNAMCDAYFSVLDTDGDGIISLPELKRMMNIFQVPEEAAYAFFEIADTNKCGTLEREELYKLFVRFWYECEYDSSIDGLYAYKY